MVKIAVDLMGGDDAPQIVIEGIRQFTNEFKDVEVLVFGDEKFNQFDQPNVHFRHCTEQITMEDEPVRSIRRKKDASMVKMAEAVKHGEADACVSAGNTGALMSAGLFIVGRIKGIERPALGIVMPTIDDKGFLLLDMGANADSKPEHLHQYALMGNIYSKAIRNISNPSIGLINIGTEEKKGNALTKETYQLLSSDASLNFVGNIEPKTLLSESSDVVICDGFTGNIVLKTLEGTAKSIFKMLKTTLTANTKNKIAAGILKKDLSGLKDKMDASEYGGAMLFGVNGVVIKAHGSSDSRAFYNALKQAKKIAEERVVETLTKEVSHIE